MPSRSSAQQDLFESGARPVAPAAEADPGRDAMLRRTREDLAAELERLRRAAAFPWPDLTASALAEMRFESLATWLPAEEAAALRAAHAAELDRLYAIRGDEA